jgi:hypothetical protein
MKLVRAESLNLHMFDLIDLGFRLLIFRILPGFIWNVDRIDADRSDVETLHLDAAIHNLERIDVDAAVALANELSV